MFLRHASSLFRNLMTVNHDLPHCEPARNPLVAPVHSPLAAPIVHIMRRSVGTAPALGKIRAKKLVGIWLDGVALFKNLALARWGTPYRNPMAIFLADISALQLWFGPDCGIRMPQPLERLQAFSGASANVRDIPRDQVRLLGLRGPLHVAIPTHSKQRNSRSLVSHVCTSPTPRTFTRLSADVYTETPIAALIRVAPRLTHGSLAMLLSQLMGTYQPTNTGLIQRRPLATRAEIEAYVEASIGIKGSKPVRQMLKYVPDLLASPAEAQAAALLLLPVQWGGKGLPMPEANGEVVVGASHFETKRYADLIWRENNLILEYDSDAFHVGAEKLHADALRRTQLQAAGYTVVTLTKNQLDDTEAFDCLVDALRHAMGKGPRPRAVPSNTQRESRLRNELKAFQYEGLLHL